MGDEGVGLGDGEGEAEEDEDTDSGCCGGGGGGGSGGRGLSQGCRKHSVAVKRFLFGFILAQVCTAGINEGHLKGMEVSYEICLTRSLEMKSLASSDTSLNASSSKSYLAMVTLAIVSTSVSPMKGERPDNLEPVPKAIQPVVNST